ncbi:KdsC family phosphatase [Candidatus Neomarinimicrobiota bacterium]
MKALFMDVDGVLTDGSIYVGPDNAEFKRFTVEDGVGVALARQAQLPLAIISGRYSQATSERAKQLKIEDIYQGEMNKLKPFEELLGKYGLESAEVAYIGDGLIDIPVLEQVGLPVTVPTAHPLVKQKAVYITERMGGKGVVLEVVEWILKQQNRFEDVIAGLRVKIQEDQIDAS